MKLCKLVKTTTTTTAAASTLIVFVLRIIAVAATKLQISGKKNMIPMVVLILFGISMNLVRAENQYRQPHQQQQQRYQNNNNNRQQRMQPNVSDATDDSAYYYEDDEGDEGTQATNINELFDFALELLWALVTKNGWDQTKLPDISEGFSYRPLLINYNAGILMTNGMLWNIHKIARYGDTYMILDRHKLKFSGNLLIEKVNFSYDVKADVMGLGPTITVDGTVVETILGSDFSIPLNDTNFNLDDLKILSLGHIRVQLTSGNLLRTVSGPFLTIITQLFRAKISTSASDGIKDYVADLMKYANKIDLFELKKSLRTLLGNLKSAYKI
ncbi:uncharacterized protein LOC129571171 [Sitodiplosis mosellana]|uniref:uncharacterized protein LOC129571171 n=1 Tax=Sitodiplosis mosellana TaxID=263140 RepID=UPI002443BCBB|nr:uncharacterized protein LOC129571171 [Sitodiplosis mosellana]XP_055306920.1 uncharacterized protein LOC129571171 [Sitodiplosis mosellana]